MKIKENKIIENQKNILKTTILINNKQIEQKDFQYIIGGLRFITNDIELGKEELNKTIQINKDVEQFIETMKTTMNQTNESDEIIMLKYEEFLNQIKILSPNYFANIFKSLQLIFSFGNSFLTDDEYIDQLDKNIYAVTQQISNQLPYRRYLNVSIKDILDSENRSTKQLPIVVESMIRNLYTKAHLQDGIFREIRNASTMEWEEIYHRMSMTNFDDLPIDVVGAVFKKFLRELPVHLLDRQQTEQLFDEWKTIREQNIDNEEMIKQLAPFIYNLQEEHLLMLKEILKICYKIQKFSQLNNMTPKNLSICMAMNLMTINDDIVTTMSSSADEYNYCIDIVELFIEYCPLLFPGDVDQDLIDMKIDVMNEIKQNNQNNDQKPNGKVWAFKPKARKNDGNGPMITFTTTNRQKNANKQATKPSSTVSNQEEIQNENLNNSNENSSENFTSGENSYNDENFTSGENSYNNETNDNEIVIESQNDQNEIDNNNEIKNNENETTIKPSNNQRKQIMFMQSKRHNSMMQNNNGIYMPPRSTVCIPETENEKKYQNQTIYKSPSIMAKPTIQNTQSSGKVTYNPTPLNPQQIVLKQSSSNRPMTTPQRPKQGLFSNQSTVKFGANRNTTQVNVSTESQSQK